MKKLNLFLDYKLPVDSKNDVKDLTISYIEGALNTSNQQGVGESERRTIARIQRKLDVATDTVELEESEFDVIKRAFKGAKFAASISKYVVILEDELERLSNEKE